MKTTLLLTGCVALATSMMILLPVHAQGGPGDGYGPPPGGPGGMMPPPGGPGHGPGAFGPSPDQLDADNDGKVTNEEYSAAWRTFIAEQFKRLDTDNDGILSKDELAKDRGPERGPHGGTQGPNDANGAPPPPPPDGQGAGRRPGMRPHHPTAEQLDANKDGKVTKDEYMLPWVKLAQERFDEMDTNKDGVLSREEMKKARGPEPGQRGPGGGFGPGNGPPQQ